MSEKRKPAIRFFAHVAGKVFRIELYPADLWEKEFLRRRPSGAEYRVRINGKWWRRDKTSAARTFMTLTAFFALFRRSVIGARDRASRKPKVTT